MAVGFLSFLLDFLLPGHCVHCGSEIGPDPVTSITLPSGWPPEALSFLRIDFTIRMAGRIELPARVLCSRCWLSMEQAPGCGMLDSGMTAGDAESDGENGGIEAGSRITRPGKMPLVAPFMIGDALLSLVRFLKFAGGRTAVPPLAWWMNRSLHGHLARFRREGGPEPLLVPVPLHRSRRLRRGYNQAALLAREISAMTGFRVEEGLLARTRRTKPQSKLGTPARAGNVAGAFGLREGAILEGTDIVLVDDLVTTGRTVMACAREVAGAGPASIVVLAAGRSREARESNGRSQG